MKEISEYDFIGWYDSETFVDKINKSIEKGWQPFGGIAITSGGVKLQALVKYRDIQPTAVIHIDENTSEQVFEEIREKLREKNIK